MRVLGRHQKPAKRRWRTDRMEKEAPFAFLEKFGSQPGLGRVSALLESWGNPQDKMKVILIGGTNGKGSTTSFLSSILRSCNHKVGSFYSPHLLRFNERIMINGKEIPDSEALGLEGEVKKWLGEGEGRMITYFEAVAACAYRYFAENSVDYAVMEVGMGGRLDAVNVAREEVAIVASIGLEHTKWLGSEIDSIAFEKAGIMKSGLAITGASLGLEKIRSEARKRGLNLLVYGEDFEGRAIRKGIGGTAFDYSGEAEIGGLEIRMLGDFQVRNACLAICAAHSLGCSADAIRAGLLGARIRGRMEVLLEEPLVVADAAHNPAGVKAMVDSLPVFGEKEIICVFACMKDKDWKEMLRALGERVSVFVFCKPADNERAEEPEELLEIGKEYAESYASRSVADAIEFARGLAGEGRMVLITGSIYMMEEAYAAMRKGES
ncbi:bifunctional folylpolyglutamate synthase/dihydrofolate synthase [Candidatus Micrarchaeota archaeon]|nr:bifunctional folylpolyglutamate synthase/dihydrofolate synthase [Candidatus Micrarchaeota archaeon]